MPPDSSDPSDSSRWTPASAEALVELRVNGESRPMPEHCSVAALLDRLGLAGRRVAVAVNRDVVPRSRFETHRLAAGDRVEILEAVGGG